MTVKMELEKCKEILENMGMEHVKIEEGEDNIFDIEKTKITFSDNKGYYWQYFINSLNKERKIVDLYSSKTGYRFEFTSINEEDSEVLVRDISKLIKFLNKRYYTVNPEKDDFSVLLKPTHNCNLDCKYCYDKPFRDTIKGNMTMDTLRSVMKRLSNYTKKLQLIWHGGEPTMVGQDWYREAHKMIEEEFPMLEVDYSMMSNGTNLNDSWLELFTELNISCGVSYNAMFQEQLRVHSQDKETEELNKTFNNNIEEILIKSKCNKDYKSIGTIDVVTGLNYKNMINTYNYYKNRGMGTSMNVMFETKETNRNNLSMSPKDYADEFMKYFKYWLHDIEGNYERSAIEALGVVIGSNNLTCTHSDCRNRWVGSNPKGDLYPCDRFLPEKYKMGNVEEFETIGEVFKSKPYLDYCGMVQKRFDTHCKECGYLSACGGGCNASAFESSGDVDGIEPFFCEQFRLKYNGVYDIVKNIDINDPLLNPVARNIMINFRYYPLNTILNFLKEKGIEIETEYDNNDLWNCSEHQLFLMYNGKKRDSLVKDDEILSGCDIDMYTVVKTYEESLGKVHDGVMFSVYKKHLEEVK